MSPEALFVERWGAGPPVVFLHGLGASARYWQRVREASSGYTGVAPDLLGFGRSPSPVDATYDVDSHLAALLPLIPPGSLVVAHSMGAVLAAAIAARHPERVRGLVLVGLPAFPDEATARREVGRLGLLARLTVAGSPLAKMLCEAMCRLRPLAIALAPHVVRDLPPSIASDGARHTWTSYSRTLEHVVVGHRPGPDLAVSMVPTILLHGKDDRVAPRVHVERLAADALSTVRRLDVRIVRGDHHLPVRDPGAVVTAMADALDQRLTLTMNGEERPSRARSVRHPFFARLYARVSGAAETKGAAVHRDELLAGLAGRVVEVGAGNGLNFSHYPPAVSEVIAVEPEPYLRRLATVAAERAPVRVTVADGLADELPLADGSVDAAVCSLVLCSVPDQAAALAEIRRVLKPEGELRFYEHVLARSPRFARFQRVTDIVHPWLSGGCHVTRETADAIEAAGFGITKVRRFRFVPDSLATAAAPKILGIARPTDPTRSPS